MCTPETLFHNENGYVAWCRSCNYISLAFGTMMMSVKPEAIKALIGCLQADIERYKGCFCDVEKAFLYDTDSQLVKIVLNYREVLSLTDLLCQAMLIHRASLLLNEDENENFL